MTERGSKPDSTPPNPSWEGLSEAAQAALTRRNTLPSAASDLLKPAPSTGFDSEAEGWVCAELEGKGSRQTGVLSRWRRYKKLLDLQVPENADAFLAQGGPGLEAKLGKLAQTKQALDESGEKTLSGKKLGKTMHLVVIPWMTYKRRLAAGREEGNGWNGSFERWLYGLADSRQDIQNRIQLDDAASRPNSVGLNKAFENDFSIYRDPSEPSQHLTFTQYLDKKIAEDGPWGVMLMQTGRTGGYAPEGKARTADEYTSNGEEHFQIAGQDVDAMGFLEWIALACQERKGKIQPGKFLLLANRSTYHRAGIIEAGAVTYYDDSNGEIAHLGYEATDPEAYADKFNHAPILLATG